MKTKVYAGFDVAKLILSIFVICIHTHPFLETSNKLLLFFNQYGFHFAVPIFFIIAGYLLFNKKSKDPIQESIPNIKVYLNKIIKLYIIWNIIYLPVSVYGYCKQGVSFNVAIYQYIRDFFLVGEHYLSWHLWYLLGTIYGLIVIMLMIKIKTPNLLMLIICYLLYALSVYVEWNAWNVNGLSGIPRILIEILTKTLGTGRLFTGVAFIGIGMFLTRSKWLNKINGYIRLCFTLLLLLVYISNPNGYGQLIIKPMLASSIVWSLAAIKTEKKILFSVCRKTSTIFYFTHMLFVFVWGIYSQQMFPEGWMCFWFSFLSCLLISAVFSLSKPYLQEAKCLLHLCKQKGCSSNI